MKRLLLVLLAAIPLFATGAGFIYYDYDYDDGGYWEDDYWYDEYWYDGAWVYYPHGYYCVYYVWWYPWWWDWYWYRCHWHNHFHWDFFYAGYYVVWYDAGVWWFRPRFGRWVQYRLPYTYQEIRYRAVDHGVYLPAKPPREIQVPFKETTIKNLMKEKDPQMFRTIEKEYKNGNLSRMQTQYQTRTQKEIVQKNREYGISDTKRSYTGTIKQTKTINQTKKTFTPVSREIIKSQVPREKEKTVSTKPRYRAPEEQRTKQTPRVIPTDQRKQSANAPRQTPKYEEKNTARNVPNAKAKGTPQHEARKDESKTPSREEKSAGSYRQSKESPAIKAGKSSKTDNAKKSEKTHGSEPEKQPYKKSR